MIWNENNVENVSFMYNNEKYNTTRYIRGYSGIVTRHSKSRIASYFNNGTWKPFNLYFQSSYFRLKQMFL